MSVSNRWLLPDGVDELLPPEAWSVELMRRAMLDVYARYGYELVSPPLIEFLESLLTGTGNNLDLQTFKLTDQLTGRTMGVRADITPQVARIDSHLLKSKGLNRLCYVDTVLHTRPAHAMTNRSPIQIGCELFGEFSQAADLEIISLMLDTLKLAGITEIHIDLAHVGIYRGLVESANLNKQVESSLFDALSRKSIPELDALAAEDGAEIVGVIRDIANLSGGLDALDNIRDSIAALALSDASSVMQAIDELASISKQIKARFNQVEIGFDFCELRGYNYHTGVMFAAYTPSYGYALAKGGRYDDIGKDFGESRPATGFSADLKTLVRLSSVAREANVGSVADSVLAPAGSDAALLNKITTLRKTQRVVQCLNDQDQSRYGCTKKLVLRDNEWQVETI
mgnify:CR=1 FL=1